MNSTSTTKETILFDIETLLNVAQAEQILWLSNTESTSLKEYQAQKSVLGQMVNVSEIKSHDSDVLLNLEQRFDIAIVYDFVEHLEKQQAIRILARLRDFLCPQYCVVVPLDNNKWQLTDMLALGLNKVSSYQISDTELALFKYSINNYKKTPDWLNADNWANPKMWGKYWW